MRVSLSPLELRQAELIGRGRVGRANAKGYRHRYGGAPPGDVEAANVAAAAAEMAVAKALNVYWADRSELDYDGDVGAYHVRHTLHASGGLILHPTDPGDAVFVLARGGPPTFDLAGWILARDGKRPEWWQTRTGRPCFIVPAAALEPMAYLETAARVAG